MLDKASAEKIITKGDFSAKQQTFLNKWAGCHPYYLQSLAGRLWLQKPRSETEIIPVLDFFKMDSKRHLSDLWNSLSEKEQSKILVSINTQSMIDSASLRAMGVITLEGKPFADILLHFLEDKHND